MFHPHQRVRFPFTTLQSLKDWTRAATLLCTSDGVDFAISKWAVVKEDDDMTFAARWTPVLGYATVGGAASLRIRLRAQSLSRPAVFDIICSNFPDRLKLAHGRSWSAYTGGFGFAISAAHPREALDYLSAILGQSRLIGAF